MSKPVLTIRADGSSSMGTGHIMRMIAIGHAWQDRGGDVRLIGTVGPLKGRLASEGFTFIEMDTPYPNPTDIETTTSLVAPKDWLVIDGYHFATPYLDTARQAGCRTLVVDDLRDRGRYQADILLNQNDEAPDFRYNINDDALLLEGTRYALLRREFLNAREDKETPQKATGILVTFGGADPVNMTATGIEAIGLLNDPSLHLKVVVGSANPHMEEIKARLDALPCTSELLTNVTNMPELMQWADIALTAGGSTCWELCYFGLPMVTIKIADNQHTVLEKLTQVGAATCLESVSEPKDIAEPLRELISDMQKRTAMSAAGRRLIDGRGALRVVDAMMNRDISLRNATGDDCMYLYDLRNHPIVRQRSFSSNPIDPDGHRKWYASKMKDSNCHIFIAEDGNSDPVGQFRFDIEGDQAYVSISTDPEMTGRGIGTVMTDLACQWLRQEHPGVRAVALVRKDNPGSAAMFRKVGFRPVKTDNTDFHRFELI